MLNNRLQGNFVSKNVVNLTGSEISLLSKGLNFRTSNSINKAKLKMELDALGRMLRLKSQWSGTEEMITWKQKNN